MADNEENGFLMTEDVTNSLLQEYSIAENPDMDGSVINTGGHGNLRDAFSRYAKVIFHDIADSYPTDADVQCFFSLTLDMKHKDGDFVGLFRLGWRSPSDIITSQSVPKPTSEDQRDFQVCFKATDLPKEEGEIYQLCYISENEVWGASVPFEFRRATAEELLVVDSGDIVIVRSQSAVAEDLKSQLASMRKDLIAAEASNLEVKKQLTELLEENKDLKERLKNLEKVEQVLERQRADNLALDKARNASEEAVRDADMHIGSLNSVVSALHKDLEILQEQVISQAEEISKYKGMTQNAAAQRGCTHDLIDALREAKELAVREMRAALADNEKMKQEVKQLTGEKNLLGEQFDDITNSYETAVQNHKEEVSEYEKRIEELLVQLTQLTSDSQQRVNDARTETELLEKRVTILQTELHQKKQLLQTVEAVSSSALLSAELIVIPDSLEEDNVKMQFPMRQRTEEQEEELRVLEKRLEDVRFRKEEVCSEARSLRADLSELQQTEGKLDESMTLLTSRLNQLNAIITDAEGCGHTIEASMFHKELELAKSKLQEKNVCIESARQRRDELEKQLKELRQENIVLYQQESETALFLATLKSPDSGSTFAGSEVDDGGAEQHRSGSCTEQAQNRRVSQEVAELRERLRQAAEAYKILYQEKIQAEFLLARKAME